MVLQRPDSDLERQPRLAEAAHAGEREQPGGAQQPAQVGDLALAPDEGRHLLRQVVRRRRERAQRREIRSQLLVQKLEDVLGTGKVAQAHRAQVAQGDGGGQPRRDEPGHRP